MNDSLVRIGPRVHPRTDGPDCSPAFPGTAAAGHRLRPRSLASTVNAPFRSWLFGLCLGSASLATVPAALAAQAAPGLEIVTEGITDGHATLSWDGPAASLYQLESSRSSSFEPALKRYAGPDTRSFVSGLEPGPHWFRVRSRPSDDAAWSSWSEPATVTIRPHSTTLAWTLFGAGAVLVVAIVGYITRSARALRSAEEGLA